MSSEDDKTEVPLDPQYNGEVVVNNKENVEEDKPEQKGLFASLFGKTEKKEEVDCELLLKTMRECVDEKNGTTMCKLEVDEWEKHCKNDEIKEEKPSDDSDDE
jgi:hypothetical protein